MYVHVRPESNPLLPPYVGPEKTNSGQTWSASTLLTGHLAGPLFAFLINIQIFFELKGFIMYLFACVSAPCLPGEPRKAEGLVELELHTVVSYHVGAGNQPWVLKYGEANALNL